MKIRELFFLTVFTVFVFYASAEGVVVSITPVPTPEQIEAGLVRIDWDFSELDDAVRALEKAESIEAVVEQLDGLAADDWEKTRAVYIWLTENIAYDAAAFFSGRRAVTNPEGVFRTGKSVCQGYADLFRSMAQGLGLHAFTVSGYSKGYGYRANQRFSRTNHAWNGVYLDGSWHLFDSTWGAGHVSGRNFVKSYDEFWFDPHPELFLMTHLPEEAGWQMVHEPVTMEEYVAMNYVMAYVFESLNTLGISDERMLESLESFPSLPRAFSYEDYDIEVQNAPLSQILKAGEPIEVRIRVPGVNTGAFINNREFVHFEKDGDFLTGTLTPVRGTLKLSLYIRNKNRESYWPVIEYQVR